MSIIAFRRFYQMYNFTMNIVSDILRYEISRLFIFCVLSIHNWKEFEKKLRMYAWSKSWKMNIQTFQCKCHVIIIINWTIIMQIDNIVCQIDVSSWFNLITSKFSTCWKKKYIFHAKLTFQIDVSSWQSQNLLIKMISTNAKFNKFSTFNRFDQSCALFFLYIHFSHFVVRKFIVHFFSLYYWSFYVYQNHSCVITSYYFSIIQSQCRLLVEIFD